MVVSKIDGDLVYLGSEWTDQMIAVARKEGTNIVGIYHYETDPTTGYRTLVVDAGGGMRVRKTKSGVTTEVGVYDADTLTGGVMVEKLNDNTVTTHIKGNRIIVGTVDDQTAQTMQDKFGDLDGLVATKATIAELNAAKARISSIESDYINTTNLSSKIANIEDVNVKKIHSDRGSAIFHTVSATNKFIFGGTDCFVSLGLRQIQVVSAGSNQYKLQYKTYADLDEGNDWQDAGTFSRATTLTGAWSGGVRTVSASPQGVSNSTYLSGLMEVENTTDGWTGNTYKAHVAYRDTTSDPTNKNTGYQVSVDASARYAAGQNNVTITKGSWSGGQISFTKSAGTASTKSVQLTAAAATWSGNTASVVMWDGTAADVQHGVSTGYTVTVDASGRYTAGQNNVTITKGSWNRGQISFTKSAGTASTKSVQLTAAAATWSGNTASVVMWDGTAADAQHGVSTGYTVTVDASGRYTAGQNNVTITKGSWSGGQISFTKSAGTASTKSVQLTAAATTWSGTTASVAIWDGTAADVQHGVSTGYTVSVDASGIYTPETSEIGFDQLSIKPSTESIAGRTKAGSFKKSNLSAPGYLFFRVGCRGTNKLYYITVDP